MKVSRRTVGWAMVAGCLVLMAIFMTMHTSPAIVAVTCVAYFCLFLCATKGK